MNEPEPRRTSFPRARLAEVQLAFLMLTRLPVGRVEEPVPPMAHAGWAFPLAGLAVGAIGGLALWAALSAGLPAAIAAGLALAVAILATGALHEDGLADVADGFGGGQTRARKLEILRDSRIGAYGTLALILVLGLRWSAIAAVVDVDATLAVAALVAIAVTSRAGLPAVLALLPPARTDGLGHASAGAAGIRPVVAVLLGLAASGLLLGPQAAAATALAQVVVVVALGWLAQRQIGGQTGDVLGAMQQGADLGAWLVLVALTA